MFDETQLGNLQSIGAALFSGDDSDPRSWNYKRELVRPVIRWTRILLFVLFLAAGAWGVFSLLVALAVPSDVAFWVSFAGTLIVTMMCLKRILICLIRIYQRYAPDHIRNKCRFEPSCSQYMILSLQKYGLRKGLAKGIDRLRRCNAQNGGFDYP